MKEAKNLRLIQQIEERLSHLTWRLLKSSSLNTGTYIVFLAIDFLYQLCIFLSLLNNLSLLSFEFEIIETLFNEEHRYNLSIVSIVLANFILLEALVLLFLGLKKQERKKSQDLFQTNHSFLYTVFSLILAIFKTFGFTLFFQILFNELVLFNKESIIQTLASSFSIAGLLLLILLQYGQIIFFNFPLPQDNLPWCETSFRGPLTDTVYKILLMVCFQFREKDLILFILIALLLLIQLLQIFNRLKLCFLINPIVQKVSMLFSFLCCHLLAMILLSPMIKENPSYLYFILLLMPIPVGLWYLLADHVEKNSLNILNQISVKSNEETTLILINLLLRFAECEKGIENKWIQDMDTIHQSICLQYFKLKEKTAEKAVDQEQQVASEEDQTMQYKIKRRQTDFAQLEDDQTINLGQPNNSQQKSKSFRMEKTTHFNKTSQIIRGDKTKKKYLSISQHIFRDHIQFDQVTALSMLLLQIFFVLQILKNPYLAQFMIQLLNQAKKKRTFQENHQVRMVSLFVEQFLTKQYEHTKKMNNLNIQRMLSMDEMTSQFESRMMKVTYEVHDFWKQLSNDNQSGQIFMDGIQLAIDLKSLEGIYMDIINQSNSKKQKEVMLKMTLFNKIVLSKEQNSELFNSVHNQANLKNLMMKDLEYKEKALMLVRFSTYQMMTVIFMNNEACSLIGYKKEELVDRPINTIMPTIISENHHKFISNYYVTWKQRMTGAENQFFIKDSNGYLRPVLLQTFAQASNTEQMVLILEACDYSPLDEGESTRPTTFLMTSDDFIVQEISHNFQRCTSIDYKALKAYQNKIDRSLALDDIITFYNMADQRLMFDHHKDIPLNVLLRGEFNEVDSGELQQTQRSRDIFNLMVIPYTFLSGSIHICIVAFQLCSNQGTIDTFGNNDFKFSTSNIVKALASNNHFSDEEQQLQHSKTPSSESISQMNESSQSSGSSRQFQNIQNRSMEFSNSVNKTSTPMTLKFINQISLIIILIILVAGTVTLILVLKSQDDAKVGVVVNNYALQRMNGMSQARNILRQMANIANGYQDNESEYIQDRFQFYVHLFEKGIQQIREQQIQLNEYESDSPILQPLEYSQVSMLSKNLSIQDYNFTTEYATNQYVNNGFEIYEKCLEYGQEYMKSDLYYFHIGMDNSSNPNISATLDERTIFYIYKQSKHSLYFQTRTFAMNFYLFVRDEIIAKTKYTKILTFVCISLIIASTLAVIPFFLRVQKRIQQLLKLFFAFDKDKMMEIQHRIENFKVEISTQQKQQIKKTIKKKKGQNKKIDQIEQEEEEVKAKGESADKMIHTSKLNESNRGLIPSIEEIKEEISESQEISNDEQIKVEKRKKGEKGGKRKHNREKDQFQKTISQRKLELYLQKRNLFQIILIIILGMISCFFFTIQYVKSLNSFNEMDSSINSQNDIGFKDFDISGLIYAISEEHMMNTTTIVVDNYGVALSMAAFLTNMFQNITADYMERVIKGQPKHLGFSLEYVNKLESTDFCECMFGNNTCHEEIVENSDYLSKEEEGVFKFMSVKECEESGVALQGLQSVLVQIFQECQQLRIHFDSALESQNRSVAYVKDKVRHQIARVADLYYVFGCNAISVLLNMSYEGINGYFEAVTKHFILIYVSFLFALFVMILYMKIYVLKNLLQEMHLSNKLLYIIDFESLQEDEQQRILKFLKDY